MKKLTGFIITAALLTLLSSAPAQAQLSDQERQRIQTQIIELQAQVNALLSQLENNISVHIVAVDGKDPISSQFSVGSNQDATVSGDVIDIALATEPGRVDSVIVLQNSLNLVYRVTVPGDTSDCKLDIATEDLQYITVEDTLEVKGDLVRPGNVVVCGDPDHYIEI